MPDISISDASTDTLDALHDATHATTSLVKTAGQAAVNTVTETATGYKDAYTVMHEIVGKFLERLPYLIIALTIIVFFWLLSRLFKHFIQKTMSNRGKQNLVLVFNRIGSTLIMGFGVMIAMVTAIPGFTPSQLISALGIGSVAIGFAFKDVFQNMLSGILLLLAEPFRIGDEIICGSFEGVVEDIHIRATNIRTIDGRRIVIPNALIYTSAVTVNTAYTRRRCSFNVGIGYDDDIDQAKKIILATLDNIRTVESTPSASVMVSSLGDFAVILTIRWWIDTKEISVPSSTDQVQALVKQAITQNGLNIPYPTQQLLMDTPPNTANEPHLQKDQT